MDCNVGCVQEVDKSRTKGTIIMDAMWTSVGQHDDGVKLLVLHWLFPKVIATKSFIYN